MWLLSVKQLLNLLLMETSQETTSLVKSHTLLTVCKFVISNKTLFSNQVANLWIANEK